MCFVSILVISSISQHGLYTIGRTIAYSDTVGTLPTDREDFMAVVTEGIYFLTWGAGTGQSVDDQHFPPLQLGNVGI